MRYKGLIVALCLLCSTAQAGPFRRPSYSRPAATPAATVAPTVLECSGDDQARCQQEANTMASRRYTGHVGGTIGRFEGVGFGSSPGCSTCTPGSGMRLTGDASACDSSGRWYRVRSWR